MHKFLSIVALLIFCQACTTLTYQEQNIIQALKYQGITPDKPAGNWEKPASQAGAGALNLLPGIGNFYLAMGEGGNNSHYLFGFLNLLSWPISVIWGIPEAAIDAGNINKKELVYFYTFNPAGQQALQERNLKLLPDGRIEKTTP